MENFVTDKDNHQTAPVNGYIPLEQQLKVDWNTVARNTEMILAKIECLDILINVFDLVLCDALIGATQEIIDFLDQPYTRTNAGTLYKADRNSGVTLSLLNVHSDRKHEYGQCKFMIEMFGRDNHRDCQFDINLISHEFFNHAAVAKALMAKVNQSVKERVARGDIKKFERRPESMFKERMDIARLAASAACQPNERIAEFQKNMGLEQVQFFPNTLNQPAQILIEHDAGCLNTISDNARDAWTAYMPPLAKLEMETYFKAELMIDPIELGYVTSIHRNGPLTSMDVMSTINKMPAFEGDAFDIKEVDNIDLTLNDN